MLANNPLDVQSEFKTGGAKWFSNPKRTKRIFGLMMRVMMRADGAMMRKKRKRKNSDFLH